MNKSVDNPTLIEGIIVWCCVFVFCMVDGGIICGGDGTSHQYQCKLTHLKFLCHFNLRLVIPMCIIKMQVIKNVSRFTSLIIFHFFLVPHENNFDGLTIQENMAIKISFANLTLSIDCQICSHYIIFVSITTTAHQLRIVNLYFSCLRHK